MRWWLAAGLTLWAGCLSAAEIVSARYLGETSRYPHGALGDDIEYTTLEVTLSDGRRLSAEWPAGMVFEDTAPRLGDITEDPGPELVTIESSASHGARLAIWGLRDGALQPLVTGPFIGQSFRWLAPVAWQDLDGDGSVEIAWIDRPHLAKTLRIWQIDGDGLREMAQMSDLTNHRYGETQISGGVRDCGQGPEMILANGNWSQLIAVRYNQGQLQRRVLPTNPGPKPLTAAMTAALSCELGAKD
ncbi:MAG: VCBS repeat-containing protein [Mangrovicoccus sp.]